jgi:hypothetical protein
VNHAHNLKVLFEVAPKSPEAITQPDCAAFMQQQLEAFSFEATINRRLATVYLLFNDLHLLDPAFLGALSS